MRVRDLMTKDVKCCAVDTNLAAVAELMWKADCGAVPVMDGDRLAGIVTDRDICIALGTRNRPAAELKAGDAATRAVQACDAAVDVHAAMAIMRRAKVRRLPVVDNGKVVGILTLNDLVQAADRRSAELDYDEVMRTVKAIGESTLHKQSPASDVAPTAWPPIPVAVA